eukprot:TRINITY_DN27423_c0_g1_i1.p1 TRINITY_DN27423_c0_g1~~TRINITY_DN27423_c0_g1_i1.p1  ORF type:complete len:120 (+),score=32.01 TRINITY_DN27423_c0_g1_i1:46-360(+)
MLRSLVGSEMCIRDRLGRNQSGLSVQGAQRSPQHGILNRWEQRRWGLERAMLTLVQCHSLLRVSEVGRQRVDQRRVLHPALNTCLLYTSDAADAEDSVALGGGG